MPTAPSTAVAIGPIGQGVARTFGLSSITSRWSRSSDQPTRARRWRRGACTLVEVMSLPLQIPPRSKLVGGGWHETAQGAKGGAIFTPPRILARNHVETHHPYHVTPLDCIQMCAVMTVGIDGGLI